MSTFSGASKAAIAQMSDGLKNQLLPLLRKLNDFIISGLSSGKFKQWGDSFSASIRPVIEWLARLGKAFMSMTVDQRTALAKTLTLLASLVTKLSTLIFKEVTLRLVKIFTLQAAAERNSQFNADLTLSQKLSTLRTEVSSTTF